MKKFTWMALLLILIMAISAIASAETYDHVLKRGMQDKSDPFPDGEDDIRYMQLRLAYYEYYTGKIDGNFGSGMQKAVIAFQRRNKLKADGRIGGNTWAALVATDSVKQSDFDVSMDIEDEGGSVYTTVGFRTLRSGDKGEAIKKIQDYLVKLYFLASNRVTSTFDSYTVDAVKGFQAAVGLSADGVVGEKTWNALETAYNNPGKYFDTGKKIRRNVGSGMRGYDVYIVQQVLKQMHHLAAIDNIGYFDTATRLAVISFQKANRIKETAKVDANTKAALWNESYEETIIEEEATSTSPYDRPKLKIGNHGYYVRSAQNYLIAAGCLTGSADGVFGKNTYNAVKKFQSLNSLKEDGIIGPGTWAKLMGVELSQGAQGSSSFVDPSTHAVYKVLKRGDSGYAVKHLQELLVKAYLLDAKDVDGKFGSKTEAAVKHFQSEAGLKVDGKCGANTFAALYNKLGLN